MIKAKQFALLTATAVTLLLIIGNWVTPARATGAKIIDGTPTPTGTPVEILSTPSGEIY